MDGQKLGRTVRGVGCGVCVGLAVLVSAAPMAAQRQPASSPQELVAVLKGARSARLLTDSHCVISGRVLGIEPEAITIQSQGRPVRIDMAALRRVEAAWPDPAWQGALWGALAGVIRAQGAPDVPAGTVAIAVALFAGVGAGIDGLIHKHELVYLRADELAHAEAPRCPRID